MFDYVLNGTCVISLQFSRVEFTANHEFVPATFHCERKNKSSVILKPVSCFMFPISYRVKSRVFTVANGEHNAGNRLEYH